MAEFFLNFFFFLRPTRVFNNINNNILLITCNITPELVGIYIKFYDEK